MRFTLTRTMRDLPALLASGGERIDKFIFHLNYAGRTTTGRATPSSTPRPQWTGVRCMLGLSGRGLARSSSLATTMNGVYLLLWARRKFEPGGTCAKLNNGWQCFRRERGDIDNLGNVHRTMWWDTP